MSKNGLVPRLVPRRDFSRYFLVFGGLYPFWSLINSLELHRRLFEGFWSFPVNLMQIVRVEHDSRCLDKFYVLVQNDRF